MSLELINVVMQSNRLGRFEMKKNKYLISVLFHKVKIFNGVVKFSSWKIVQIGNLSMVHGKWFKS